MTVRAEHVTVLVVVGDDVERDGVAVSLAEQGLRSLADVATVEDALVRLDPDDDPIVLMDWRVPGLSGAAGLTALRETVPHARIVVLSDNATAPLMLAVFGAGAHGLVVKDSEPAVLGQAVRAVADGGIFVDPQAAPGLVELASKGGRAKGPYGLTRQQLRVLEFLAEGMTNRAIAEELVLSAETIKSHVRVIMAKVGVHNRAELARRATEEGLV